MTIKYFGMGTLALVGAVMTSCSGDSNFFDEPQQPANADSEVTLMTTLCREGDVATTRSLTADGVKTFAVGDQIAVVYENKSNATVKTESVALTAADITDGGQSATFTVTLRGPKPNGSVKYIYPAAMAKADGSINYEALASQDGTLATIASDLDLAVYDGTLTSSAGLPASATLSNKLAILACTLKNSDGTNDITSTFTGVTITEGTNTYTVTRTAAAGSIYVAIRPTTSATINVTATDGTKLYGKSLTGKTYAASNGYSVSWRMTIGKFTINAGGTQVYFSRGNLQATYDGSSWTWGFAENQWDYIGNAGGNRSVNGNGTVSASNVTVDLFGWVGASSTWTGAAQYGISNSTTNNSTSTYGNVADEALKSDWGNTISDGYTWHTPTSSEWTYVFNTRTTGGTVFGTASARYAHATINTDGTSVNGVILFPDGVDIASTEVTTAGSVNATSAYATKCNSAQWTALAVKGCVFLPAAGIREKRSVYNVGSVGCYWSSSPYTSGVNYACLVSFNSGILFPAHYDNRSFGGAVRLVRQVE